MSAAKRQFSEDARFGILRLLQERPDLTQREIAQELGVALGSVNYALRALIERGLVKTQNFRNAENKLKYVYMLTPKGVAAKTALTGRFLARKMAEYEALKAEIAALKLEASEGTVVAGQMAGDPLGLSEEILADVKTPEAGTAPDQRKDRT